MFCLGQGVFCLPPQIHEWGSLISRVKNGKQCFMCLMFNSGQLIIQPVPVRWRTCERQCLREVRLSLSSGCVWHVYFAECLGENAGSLCADVFGFRDTSCPEPASQGERVAPDGGDGAAGVMLNHCSGLEHLLWLQRESKGIKISNQSYDTSAENVLGIMTFGWVVLLIRGELDLDLTDSFLLLRLPWWTSSVSSLVVWRIRLPGLLSESLLKPCVLQCWFWVRLRPHVNSTENSSPEGESINTARPSSDLTMVLPPDPSSASREDHSGHCTSESMLKKGCRRQKYSF